MNLVVTAFLTFLVTVSFYFSSSRHNDYEIGRSFSVSDTDIKTVHQIAAKATSDDYIVLANQIVSAAALREFGFKKYYKQQISPTDKEHFYYAIPTGEALYQFYLEMVYDKPSRQTADKAAKLVGVNEVFLVLNDYWTNFEKNIQNAMANADEYFVIDGGKVYVFRYVF